MKSTILVIACAALLMACAIEPAPAVEGPDAEPLPNSREHDHFTDHNWQLEIEGVTQGAFAEVSGLDSETEVVARGGAHLRPSFKAWVRASAAGTAPPRTLVLLTKGPLGQTLRYRLIGAQVTRYAPASGNSAMTEEIEMVIERLERG